MGTDSKVFFNNLRGGLPVAVRGEGIFIEDESGRRYIDGIGGMFVCTIGHGVPEVAEAMAAQARTLSFANYVQFTNAPLEALASHVIEMAPEGIEKAFFVPSGSIANEIALQIAREYHVERGRPGKHRVISQYHNYYGMTVGALSMSGNLATKRRMHMDPYLLRFPHIQPPHCYQCPFGRTYPDCGLFCADELARTLEQENPDTIAAFIATPSSPGPAALLPRRRTTSPASARSATATTSC